MYLDFLLYVWKDIMLVSDNFLQFDAGWPRSAPNLHILPVLHQLCACVNKVGAYITFVSENFFTFWRLLDSFDA